MCMKTCYDFEKALYLCVSGVKYQINQSEYLLIWIYMDVFHISQLK